MRTGGILMFEHRHEPLLARTAFAARLVRHALMATGMIAGSLGIGVVGYHGCEGMPWIDALVNAAMILGGMGPVNPGAGCPHPAQVLATSRSGVGTRPHMCGIGRFLNKP
ncbi:MAG: hypothetical protein AB1792_00305 [Candidatus Zixiibacteriota bacterium]